MSREVYTVCLRRTYRLQEPSLVRDVVDLVLGGTLLFLLYVLAVLVMA